jgi:outer membrane protein assembly factor BamB
MKGRWVTAAIVAVAMMVATSVPASAAPRVEWMRRAGDHLAAVARTQDGGTVVTGYFGTGTDRPLLVRRYGPKGRLVWSRAWSPPKGGEAYGWDVTVAPDGAVYVAGLIGCTGYEAGGFFVRKYSPAGVVRWTRFTSGGWCQLERPAEQATGIAVGGGLVAVVGHQMGCCGLAMDDAWVRAYRPDGRLLWVHDFEVPGVNPATDDALRAVAVDGSGSVYVTGYVAMAVNDDTATPVDQELVVQKLSRSGARRWTWLLRDRAVKDGDVGTGIALREGRLVVTGAVNRRRYPPSEGWLARFSTDGRVLWRRTWGDPAHAVWPADVAITSTFAAIVTGSREDRASYDEDLFLRRVAPDGSLRWKTVIGGPADIEGTGVAVVGDHVAYTTGGRYRVAENAGLLWRWRI